MLLVGLGGALGSVLRFLTSLLAAHWLGAEFPYGTLIVNVTGSFVIGLVQQVGTDTLLIPDTPQTALVKTLYDQYQQYAQAYKQAKAAGDRSTTSALYKGWQAHLDQFAVDNPAAKQVVRTVFARLPRPVPDLEAAQ